MNSIGVRPKGSEVRPKGSEVKPNGSEVEPNGSEVKPNGSEVRPKGPRCLATRGDLGAGRASPSYDGISERLLPRVLNAIRQFILIVGPAGEMFGKQ